MPPSPQVVSDLHRDRGSVLEQCRHRHVAHEVAGGRRLRSSHACGASVGTHDKEVSPGVGHAREDLIADTDVDRDRRAYGGFDAMTRERSRNRGVRRERVASVPLLLDFKNVRTFRPCEESRASKTARRFACCLPRDHDNAVDLAIAALAGRSRAPTVPGSP
jgi:hypothetical protein